MKKTNRRGFTLMEMLIVVAIIAILIAIAIPTFTSTLEKARETADLANIRSAYGAAMIAYLDADGAASETTPPLTQTNPGWQYTTEAAKNVGGYDISSMTYNKNQTVTVTVTASGNVLFSVN